MPTVGIEPRERNQFETRNPKFKIQNSKFSCSAAVPAAAGWKPAVRKNFPLSRSMTKPDQPQGNDPLGSAPLPKINPWLALVVLFLALLAHILIWAKLLGG